MARFLQQSLRMTAAAMHNSTTREAEAPFECLQTGTVADITYMNASGQVSERRIEITSRYCSQAGTWYLRAYCHLRGEERTFREDRVLSIRKVQPGPSSHGGRTGGSPHAGASRRPTAGGTPARGASAASSPAAGRTARPRSTVGPAGHAPSHTGTPTSTPAAAPTPGPATGPTHVPIPGSAAEPRTAPSRESGHVIPRLLGLVAAAAVIVFFAARDGADWTPRPEPTPAPDTLVARVAELAKTDTPARTAPPRKMTDMTPGPAGSDPILYRGEQIDRHSRGGTRSYTVGGLDRSFATLQEARLAINRREFVAVTGISNRDLLQRYAGADTNGDGDLDWDEIRLFQERLYKEYRYLTNQTALTPDAFFRKGGGDCEDWALVTAGLLQFWQIPVYLASIASNTGFHAVALVRTPRPPAGALFFTFEDWPNLPDGKYVPIDYDAVGDLTNAVGRDYRIRKVWVPHTVYNHVM